MTSIPAPTTSSAAQFFNAAQTFYVDPSVVRNSPTLGITAVNLYFKQAPKATGNKSGIDRPGVNIFICGVNPDDTPDLSTIYGQSRKEYGEVAVSGDATSPTHFVFAKPLKVATGKSYAILIKFDGNEDFVLWVSKEGETLVGQNSKTAGPAGQYIGKYYTFASTAQSTVGGVWNPLTSTDLKFDLYCAQYTGETSSNSLVTNTVTGQAQTVTTIKRSILAPDKDYEFIIFDKKSSLRTANVIGGELVFQNSTIQNSNVSVSAQSFLVNTTSGNFSLVFDDNSGVDNYIVLWSGNDSAVRRVIAVQSNTSLLMDSPAPFTNASCYWSIAPVARLFFKNQTASLGKTDNMIILNESNANSTVKFSNGNIETIYIGANGGSGYNNADYVVVYGGGSSVNATANVTTNSTGGIVSYKWANMGLGFVSAPSFSVKNSTGGTANGTNANLTFKIGSTIITDQSNAYFANTTVMNYEVHGLTLSTNVVASPGTKYDIRHALLYTVNATSGNSYSPTQNTSYSTKSVQINTRADLSYTGRPLIVSRSNEVAQPNVVYTKTTGNTANTNHSSLVEVTLTSNNAFMWPTFNADTIDVFTYQYLINNDYTNENTKYGNALAKHITTKINFADGRFAEDMIVYLRAYRPSNTDIKVLVKFHNSKDPDAFDDKDWTLLTATDGANTYSSPTDNTDLIELTYEMPLYPNTYFVHTGTVTTSLSSATITGSNTDFANVNPNTGFAANDLVKIYPPLFPNNYVVAVVNSVTNSTQLTITEAITNTSLVGSGFKIEKLAYKAQAFKNGLNSNVARYYNSSMVAFDTYDTFAVKMVLLSDTKTKVPMIDDIRAVGVSA